MAQIYIVEFNKWNDLTNYIDSKFTHYNNFIFRGHANSDWKLESTLARSINSIYPGRDDVQTLIDDHLRSFKINIRGKSNINFKDISNDDLWAMGQHFGLFTPLLDFTKSPYVALFFALQGQSDNGKRCLWALNEPNIKLMKLQQLDSNLQLEKIIPFTNDNPRLVNQQGLFLKIPLNSSVETMIDEYDFKGKGVSFFKLIFDDKLTKEGLSVLQNMNINQLTLFPDLTGSAKHSNSQFEMKPYLAEGRIKLWEEFEKVNIK